MGGNFTPEVRVLNQQFRRKISKMLLKVTLGARAKTMRARTAADKDEDEDEKQDEKQEREEEKEDDTVEEVEAKGASKPSVALDLLRAEMMVIKAMNTASNIAPWAARAVAKAMGASRSVNLDQSTVGNGATTSTSRSDGHLLSDLTRPVPRDEQMQDTDEPHAVSVEARVGAMKTSTKYP